MRRSADVRMQCADIQLIMSYSCCNRSRRDPKIGRNRATTDRKVPSGRKRSAKRENPNNRRCSLRTHQGRTQLSPKGVKNCPGKERNFFQTASLLFNPFRAEGASRTIPHRLHLWLFELCRSAANFQLHPHIPASSYQHIR